jgi:hypothetical protein
MLQKIELIASVANICRMTWRLSFLWVLSLFLCAGSLKTAGTTGTAKQEAVAAATPSASTTDTTGSAGTEGGANSSAPVEKPGILAGSIQPPFGLRWGESKEEVRSQLATAGAGTVKRSNVDGREVLAIEGITQPSLQQAIAYFDARKTLVEVELQYGDAAWTFDAYRAFVVSVTRSLQAYYGEPTVLARDRRPQGNNIETIAGYQWQQADLSGVLLFFFAVEQGKNRYTTVSVHYRGATAGTAAGANPDAIGHASRSRPLSAAKKKSF